MFSYSLLDSPFQTNPQILDAIAQATETESRESSHGTLNIAFVSDEEIQRLNREYRGIDKVTDVLSFHYFEDFSELADDEIAGEIILSEHKVFSQSEEYGETPEAEFYKLVIHSTLHILGYDHETEEDYALMRPIEEKIEQQLLEEFGVKIG